MASIAAFADIGSRSNSPCAHIPAAWWRASPSPSACTRTPNPHHRRGPVGRRRALSGEMRGLSRRIRQDRHDFDRLPQSRLSRDPVRPHSLAGQWRNTRIGRSGERDRALSRSHAPRGRSCSARRVIGSVELERLSREGERDARVRQHWLRLQSVEGRSLPEFGFFAYATRADSVLATSSR